MRNARRGEIEAELGGGPRRLVLTLGSLAELEAHFEASDLVDLAERFATGRLAAGDLAAVIGAGLRGAGEAISDREVAALTVEGGAASYARIVSELLSATFGGGDASGRDRGEGTASAPFERAKSSKQVEFQRSSARSGLRWGGSRSASAPPTVYSIQNRPRLSRSNCAVTLETRLGGMLGCGVRG